MGFGAGYLVRKATATTTTTTTTTLDVHHDVHHVHDLAPLAAVHGRALTARDGELAGCGGHDPGDDRQPNNAGT